MGLFVFLIVMLAAAWGIVWEINQPVELPPPVAKHAPAKPSLSATASEVPDATATQAEMPSPSTDALPVANAPEPESRAASNDH